MSIHKPDGTTEHYLSYPDTPISEDQTMTARDILQHTHDVLTSFLLDNVDENRNWEDAYPELDELRAQIGEILAKPLNLTEGVES